MHQLIAPFTITVDDENLIAGERVHGRVTVSPAGPGAVERLEVALAYVGESKESWNHEDFDGPVVLSDGPPPANAEYRFSFVVPRDALPHHDEPITYETIRHFWAIRLRGTVPGRFKADVEGRLELPEPTGRAPRAVSAAPATSEDADLIVRIAADAVRRGDTAAVEVTIGKPSAGRELRLDLIRHAHYLTSGTEGGAVPGGDRGVIESVALDGSLASQAVRFTIGAGAAFSYTPPGTSHGQTGHEWRLELVEPRRMRRDRRVVLPLTVVP